jgi:hypothetical protein
VASTEAPSLLPACVASALCSVIATAHGASASEPDPRVLFFLTFLPLSAVCLWLQGDARRRGAGYMLDLGFFIWLCWPVVLPWYAFSTRGRPGWRLASGLVGVIVAPTVCGGLATVTAQAVTWATAR